MIFFLCNKFHSSTLFPGSEMKSYFMIVFTLPKYRYSTHKSNFTMNEISINRVLRIRETSFDLGEHLLHLNDTRVMISGCEPGLRQPNTHEVWPICSPVENCPWEAGRGDTMMEGTLVVLVVVVVGGPGLCILAHPDVEMLTRHDLCGCIFVYLTLLYNKPWLHPRGSQRDHDWDPGRPTENSLGGRSKVRIKNTILGLRLAIIRI